MFRIWWKLALAALVLWPSFAQADTMTWRVRSFSSAQVELVFYSQNRRHEWPGNSKAFILKDYKVHDVKLTCVNGEKICYGAWLRGNQNRYWGTGKGGKRACKDCCMTCENASLSPIMNLNER